MSQEPPNIRQVKCCYFCKHSDGLEDKDNFLVTNNISCGKYSCRILRYFVCDSYEDFSNE